MKIVAPSYYKKFRCLADKCRHTCCAGWEIDIDEVTLKKYREIKGSFGMRLKNAIDFKEDVYSFKLTEDERCPFLNKNGLCDIYTQLGEESLCSICRDHPRFRNYFSSQIELGVGLCCEAAAKLVIEDDDGISFSVVSDDGEDCADTEEEKYFFEVREDIFDILRSDDSCRECIERIIEYTGAVYPKKTVEEWADVFLRMERLDESWTVLLNKLKRESGWLENYVSDFPKGFDREFKRLMAYFVYRSLADSSGWQELCARVCFCVISCEMIRLLSVAELKEKGSLNLSSIEELSRLYSSEIEYSAENAEALLDIFMAEN